MSRILQALKQLEARPATGAASEARAPAVTQPIVPPTPTPPSLTRSASEAPASPEAPAPPSDAARTTPRRKKKKLRRAPVVEERAAATAEEIEQLLSSLGPGVISCWEERPTESSAVIQTRGD